MKIPFDIKYRPQIESGEYKVETVDGRTVRIICWDRIATEPYDNCNIVALVTGPKSKTESTYYYYQDGHLWNKTNDEGDSLLDLYIVTPEPELTEFEKAVKNMMSPYVKMPDEIHKEKAAKLLELARIQFLEEQYTSDPRKTDLYKLGKEEALKDLPKWKKADRDWDAGTIDFAVFHKNDGGDHEDWLSVEVTNRLYKGEYYIELSDLEKLPKED